MKTILLINGHEPYDFAKGEYNQRLYKEIEENLSTHFKILKTKISEGYDVKTEQEKFKKADLIIFQFPIYWFNTPGLLKKYLDEVYEFGVFFGMGSQENVGDHTPKKYGFGNGLMTGKKYMLSVTMNAPEYAFDDTEQFFEGRNLDDLLLYMHKTQQFCGLEGLKSFAAYDVIKNPQMEKDLRRLKEHLQQTIIEEYFTAQVA